MHIVFNLLTLQQIAYKLNHSISIKRAMLQCIHIFIFPFYFSIGLLVMRRSNSNRKHHYGFITRKCTTFTDSLQVFCFAFVCVCLCVFVSGLMCNTTNKQTTATGMNHFHINYVIYSSKCYAPLCMYIEHTFTVLFFLFARSFFSSVPSYGCKLFMQPCLYSAHFSSYARISPGIREEKKYI